MISESDWKKFKKIKQTALDRFCSRAVADYAAVLSDPKLTSHGKHFELYALVKSYDKGVARLFDDHSRSKATLQLLLLRAENLVTDEELATLSEELRKATTPLSL